MLQTMINIMPYVIALLSFCLVMKAGLTYSPGRAVYKTYIRINNTLKEKKSGLFDYEEIKAFLQANGAAGHYGRWVDPIRYLALEICAAAFLFLVGIRIHFLASIGMCILGFLLPGMLLRYMNAEDNKKMIKDLQLLYDALQIQIRSGVHVTHAISESYRSISKGRLRTALRELSTELYMKCAFEECVSNFNKKFNSVFIDSLCLILIQAQETGKAVDLLRDMTAQIEDMRSVLQLKKKEQLNRITTFCLLGIMSSMLGVVIYAAVTTMFHTANNF